VSYVINDLFLLRHPFLRCQEHILCGGENVLQDADNGCIIKHVNDTPAAQHYQMMLSSTFVPFFRDFVMSI